jgi:arabinogalactan oligomer/maltooligosaccharide transport system substrate-binding protein
MRRITIAGAATVGLALALSACSSSSNSNSPSAATGGGGATSSAAAGGGTLTIWADNSANTAKAIEPLCVKWAQANGVNCVVKKFNGGGPLDEALIKAAQAGNDLPDIFEGPHNGLGKYLSAGIVAPVDISANKSKFQEQAVNAVSANGNTYGVPWAVENVAMLTNKTLSPTCPASMDDAVAKAKSLIASGKSPKGQGISIQIGNQGDYYHWYPWFSAEGGYAYKQKSDGSWDTANLGIDTPGGVAAGNRLKQMAADGVVSASVTFDIAKATFSGGKSAYFITGPWAIPDMKKALADNLMVCPVPPWAGNSNKAQPFLGVRVFFQTAKAKNAALAQTFLSDEVQTTAFMDGMFATDPRPSAWLESFQKESADPIVKAFGEYGQGGVPMPAIPQMDNVFTETGLAQYKIATGQDPAATLKVAADAIKKKNATLG